MARMPPVRPVLAGGSASTRWRLAPLLAVRTREEERWRDELGRALALVREAEEEAERLRAHLARKECCWALRGLSSGAELATAERFVERLRREAGKALERARNARMETDDLRERLLRAREARERLERGWGRWLEERRRMREARLQGELDDLGARAPHPRVRYRFGP